MNISNVEIKNIVNELCEKICIINNTYKMNSLNSQNDKRIASIKQKGIEWVDKIELNTHTKPGSLTYLLFGEKPSNQSINIKIGKLGEYLSKELIKTNNNLELMMCGVQKINEKKKDIDLLFKNKINKTLHYYELKGNIELDTEKLPATINKCKEIEKSLKETYSEYSIICRILNWSVYNRKILKAGLSNIKVFESKGMKIEHMEDFLKTIDIVWDENDYYSYFREIGNKIECKF